MSILQEYEQVKKDVGEYKWNCIDYYLQEHPDLTLDKIIYNKENWEKYDKWFNEDRNKSVEILHYWKSDYDDVRANALLKLNNKQVANIIVSFDEKDISDLTKTPFEESEINAVENAIAVLTIKDFDDYLSLPKISECSSLLQDIYDEVCETEYTMCYITDENWKEDYANKYTEKDVDFLKSEVLTYNLKDIITFDDGEYKIIGWGNLETCFNDDRNFKSANIENNLENYTIKAEKELSIC